MDQLRKTSQKLKEEMQKLKEYDAKFNTPFTSNHLPHSDDELVKDLPLASMRQNGEQSNIFPPDESSK